MRKYVNFILTNFIFIQLALGQQSPKLNDYPYFYSSNEFYAKSLVNPGYTGQNGQHEFQISGFGQWFGPINGLSNYYFLFNGFFEKISSGIGLKINLESYGEIDKRDEISGLYSYKIFSSSNIGITLGTKLGFTSRKIINDVVMINEKTIIGSGNWINSPIIDLGVIMECGKFNFGIAYKNVISNTIKFWNYQTILNSKGFTFDATYAFALKDKFFIKPYFIDYYYNLNSFSFGLMTEMNEKFLAGFGYNTYYKKIDATLAVRIFKYLQLGYIVEMNKDYGYSGILLKLKIKPSS